jgi:pyruvate/2-oxoglutarate/acetoin dehydrogenase E1 component/TPP-dependent pyruvate/acetoin dehydrogenase alpha subunit
MRFFNFIYGGKVWAFRRQIKILSYICLMSTTKKKQIDSISFEDFKKEVLADYQLGWESRYVSTIGRKEVLTGKAKFGIFGAGKELAQIALAKFFQKGDFRTGYYRDQTLALATGNSTIKELFAQLYAHANVEKEPISAGRMMNAHFASRSLDDKGQWKNLMEEKNFAADLSPTAAQALKALGLGLASKLYRNNTNIQHKTTFTDKGNELTFVTIGDASTSEGIFWESVNAACVLQVPIIYNVWDDGYGISVPQKYQTAKESISQSMSGMQTDSNSIGMDIYKVPGWDYPSLVQTYKQASERSRKTHSPALVHVIEVTQPEGHSTSGSHERYKSEERMKWEKDFDCLIHFKSWILTNKLASEAELSNIENEAQATVNKAKTEAFEEYINEIQSTKEEVRALTTIILENSSNKPAIESEIKTIESKTTIFKRDILKAIHNIIMIGEAEKNPASDNLRSWYHSMVREGENQYGSFLHSQSSENALLVKQTAPDYDGAIEKAGYEVINTYFDKAFGAIPELVAFGEDLGQIGDVNQGFAGLQEKYGEERIFDCGIREATIIGQGQGLSMRGLRPIAEIQYLDYLLYGLMPLSDDVATLQYRTHGGQKAPMIVRTRGHRLEGIWHSGSPIGMIIHSLRGMYVCTPRNLTQAAGMYQTLLLSDEPGLVIEPLNGYRLKEKMPTNIGEYTIALGQVEVMAEGSDITMVSYGPTLKICMDAMEKLSKRGISVELIDIQTLLPFDIGHDIVKSLRKTNRLVIVDEDVPGGASAYLLQQILECQNGYRYLDSQPLTITGKAHRPAYGSDGDYFSKSNSEEVYDKVLELILEAKPHLSL